MQFSIHLPVKGQKTSNPGQIQDTMKSRTGPRNKGLSWKIQDRWSPYSFVNDSRRNFSPIFTKFGTLIAEVIFKAESTVFDRKRKYFARMRGSRISVFCAIYSIALSDLSLHLARGRHCVLAGGPRRLGVNNNKTDVQSSRIWTDTVFDRT